MLLLVINALLLGSLPRALNTLKDIALKLAADSYQYGGNSSTVRQSASNAQLASQAGGSNLHEADNSTRLTDELTHVMEDLTSKPERMRVMVQTIDAIDSTTQASVSDMESYRRVADALREEAS